MNARKLETVKGYNAAAKALTVWVNTFNELNGKERMRQVSPIEYVDDEGSGEFYRAICSNINTASCCDDEIYDIFGLW